MDKEATTQVATYGGAGATAANYATTPEVSESFLDFPIIVHNGFSLSIRDAIFLTTATVAIIGFIRNQWGSKRGNVQSKSELRRDTG